MKTKSPPDLEAIKIFYSLSTFVLRRFHMLAAFPAALPPEGMYAIGDIDNRLAWDRAHPVIPGQGGSLGNSSFTRLRPLPGWSVLKIRPVRDGVVNWAFTRLLDDYDAVRDVVGLAAGDDAELLATIANLADMLPWWKPTTGTERVKKLLHFARDQTGMNLREFERGASALRRSLYLAMVREGKVERLPLQSHRNTTAEKALKFIDNNPGASGPQIHEAVGGSYDHLRRILPRLHGIVNDRKMGYRKTKSM